MLKQNYVKLQPICFVSELAFQPLELYWKSNHSPKPNCIGRSLQLFPGTEIDCTTDKIYSLSDETRDKIGNIEKPVTITLINLQL